MMYAYATTTIVAAMISAVGAWTVQSWRIDSIKAHHVQEINEARAQAEAKTTAYQDSKDDALRRANRRAIAQQTIADTARSELDRLRLDIASRDAQDTGSAGADSTAASRALLAECAAQYSELAAKADRHSSDAVMLYEAWPK